MQQFQDSLIYIPHIHFFYHFLPRVNGGFNAEMVIINRQDSLETFTIYQGQEGFKLRLNFAVLDG